MFSLAVLAVSALQAQTKNFIDQPYIEVRGEADTLITPDEIYIKISLSEKDTKNNISVEALEKKMVDALQSLGIATQEDLTTSDMSSDFRNRLWRNKEVLKTKEYMLKVHDAATAGKVFVQLEALGISHASIDRVSHTDLDGISNLMRTAAVRDAKAKAWALAQPLGQAPGMAIHITENNSGIVAPLLGRVAGLVAATGYGAQNKQEEWLAPDFEKIKVAAQVYVTFTLSGTGTP